MAASGDECGIRRRYSDVGNLTRNMTLMAVIEIGPEHTAIAVGSAIDPEAIALLDIGSQKVARKCFRHAPPTPIELERAIHIIEDEVAPARTLIPQGSTVYTIGPTVLEVAALTGVPRSFAMTLGIADVEQLFDRMASALGRPALQERMLSSPEVVATITILREFMHHLKIPMMICLDFD